MHGYLKNTFFIFILKELRLRYVVIVVQVMTAFSLTAVVTLILTIFAFKTDIDFTGLGSYLFLGCLVLLVSGVAVSMVRTMSDTGHDFNCVLLAWRTRLARILSCCSRVTNLRQQVLSANSPGPAASVGLALSLREPAYYSVAPTAKPLNH